eukprot:TRINITY_DN8191_c0_g1_i1.p1 TRINITY_DN8191_c0_g1~~TRINITY_DN8191_c0_g1_i1.p1  ORF type:complete len:346 (+),score=8.77 TRINITY_DN8191_c0_g1_i1:33-1070(+)
MGRCSGADTVPLPMLGWLDGVCAVALVLPPLEWAARQRGRPGVATRAPLTEVAALLSGVPVTAAFTRFPVYLFIIFTACLSIGAPDVIHRKQAGAPCALSRVSLAVATPILLMAFILKLPFAGVWDDFGKRIATTIICCACALLRFGPAVATRAWAARANDWPGPGRSAAGTLTLLGTWLIFRNVRRDLIGNESVYESLTLKPILHFLERLDPLLHATGIYLMWLYSAGWAMRRPAMIECAANFMPCLLVCAALTSDVNPVSILCGTACAVCFRDSFSSVLAGVTVSTLIKGALHCGPRISDFHSVLGGFVTSALLSSTRLCVSGLLMPTCDGEEEGETCTDTPH